MESGRSRRASSPRTSPASRSTAAAASARSACGSGSASATACGATPSCSSAEAPPSRHHGRSGRGPWAGQGCGVQSPPSPADALDPRRLRMKNTDLLIAANTVWVVVAAVLVMFMQAGFAFLEAGLTRMKNAAHIAGKNVLIFGICSLVYWAVGFGLAFGDGNAVIGTHGFFPSVDSLAP